ncbi:hypothetical protein IM40_01240 [Candidatus Paracaedimonas acanthamoebae]|nr:hypothetical protein IM40_01240 [Candidatus Paracaedimonas acanthamoebae]
MLSKFVFLLWTSIFYLVVSNDLVASESYVIKNVQVDVTGSSASEARTKAMADAQRQAYNILLEKVLPQHDSSLPSLTDEQLDALVQSIEVQSEKNSDVRYLGTLTIHFNPKTVQMWFAQQNKKVVSPSLNKTTVIVPVLVRNEKTLLWEENNPWWQAWNQKTDLDSEALVIPMGDLQDLKNLSAKDALEGNIDAIRKMLSRYQADRMIITIFYENSPSRLEVHHYTSEGLIDHSPLVEFDMNEYAPATLLPFAITKVIEASKTTLQASLHSESKKLHLIITFNNYPEWINLQEQLKSLQGVKKITIHNLSLRQAQVSLICSSSETFIENQLKAKGIIIEQEPSDITSKVLSLRLQESKHL